MSVQVALHFIEQFRADEQFKTRLLALNKNPNLEGFVQLGSELGLHFTVAELQEAHKYDWAMRGLLYSKDDG
ncbi:Nif11-like leader peptide family natural product precursor [Roseofilum sp. Guam]|uniref:Nif11-like leader peptide family natural product precursor n=1 Tax=Roseofilum sp. Guam TaxID=2821502 RepID=UPI001B22C822|nr:Nif11-like leader peptide family natural product precursor [Roseofilum sp. Guam]MBP0027284.1 Nif11-like leader peptide family natural product precursor [Roseofilum sp. Guam]